MITIPIDNGVMVISVWGVVLIGAAVVGLVALVALLIGVVAAARRRGGEPARQGEAEQDAATGSDGG